MDQIDVRSVDTERDRAAFLRLPWVVYSDDPNWVAPLWREHVRHFDPGHNVELRHIDFQPYVAWRGDRPVGTIIAHINRVFNETHRTRAGWFGQYEVLEDHEAGNALLQTAENWVRERGAELMLGPATFSSNSEFGLLIDGFETPPMIMMTHARPYYRQFIEQFGGYERAMDLWAWRIDSEGWGGTRVDKVPRRLTRVVEMIKAKSDFAIRTPNMKRFTDEVDHVKSIYNDAFTANWGFVPISDEEIDDIAGALKDIIDPHISFFVEHGGRPIAFGLPLPNVYEPLHKIRCKPGEPHWLQLLRLLWQWKIRRGVTSVRIWALGVLHEYRRLGADGLLYTEMIRAGLPRGYRTIEMSWVLADNDNMNSAIRKLGATVEKTYRVYQKKL